MLFLKPWNCKSQPNARVLLHGSIVWCWVTPGTMVCIGIPLYVIRFRRKCCMEVIDWTCPTWYLSSCCFARCNPVRFITGHGTIPMPTSWWTTSCIHRLHLACGPGAPTGRKVVRMWCRIVSVSLTGTTGSLPRYSEWEWHTGQVSYSQARIPLEIKQTPIILQKSNKSWLQQAMIYKIV